jgi:hypothetical protein
MHLDDLRALALALPEAEEHDHFGRPSFRVRGRIFMTVVADEARCNLKLPREEHEALVAERPDVFATVTWGQLIRTSVRYERVAQDELGELLEEAWRAVAPKRVVADFNAMPGRRATAPPAPAPPRRPAAPRGRAGRGS